MSEPVSALPGANYQGFVTVAEAGLRGMITLRGDLGATKLKNAVKKLTGVAVPATGLINLKDRYGAAWMSPDELLLLLPYGQIDAAVEQLAKSLKGSHHLIANVSDARAVFTLTGAQARDVLAKLSPADLSGTGFTPAQIRRSRVAQVPAAFWVSGEDQIDLVCFRSVADYVFGLLKNAAHPDSQIHPV